MHRRTSWSCTVKNRSNGRERNEGHYPISECAYGCFERTVPLPDEMEPDKVTAKYRRSVLRVELPKTPTQRRQRLKFEVR